MSIENTRVHRFDDAELALGSTFTGARWNQYREFQVTIGRSPNDAQELDTFLDRKRQQQIGKEVLGARRNLNKIGLC